MDLTNSATVEAKVDEITQLSNGFVSLQRHAPTKRGKPSQHWLLFIDGHLTSTMRTARVMSFCDGYLLASVTSKPNDKAILIESGNGQTSDKK